MTPTVIHIGLILRATCFQRWISPRYDCCPDDFPSICM